MTRLIATRGLPASGKTTFARTLQPLWEVYRFFVTYANLDAWRPPADGADRSGVRMGVKAHADPRLRDDMTEEHLFGSQVVRRSGAVEFPFEPPDQLIRKRRIWTRPAWRRTGWTT